MIGYLHDYSWFWGFLFPFTQYGNLNTTKKVVEHWVYDWCVYGGWLEVFLFYINNIK